MSLHPDSLRPPQPSVVQNIVLPLVDQLHDLSCNDTYFNVTDSFLHGPFMGEYSAIIECAISRGDIEAYRAIATLLRATASQDRLLGDGPAELYPMWTPIHFIYVKKMFDVGPEENLHYLWCNGYTEDFSVEAARVQVAHLVRYLSNKTNLVTLTPEELGRM